MIALTSPQLHSIDEVIHGEALLVLRTLPDNSVDAIVCDPPAGISFMGKQWDNYSGKEKTYNSAGARAAANADKEKLKRIGQGTTPYGFSSSSGQPTQKERDAFISFLTLIMAEALRVLKPGGHAFVWALPRTSHWTGIALEDAGFEIRDVVTHLFGSGFPKSHDISAAIDRMQGAERKVVGTTRAGIKRNGKTDAQGGIFTGGLPEELKHIPITAPATPEASQWNGWGTALKPASEHWYLVRKPLSEKSISANVLKWGVGAINIEVSRINPGEHVRGTGGGSFGGMFGNGGKLTADPNGHTQGRWPANLLLSHSVWCVPNGVKKVKVNDKAHDRHNSIRVDRPIYGDYGASVTTGYADSEGMEQVEDWLCDESCPVRLLDEQSGVLHARGNKRPTKSTRAHSIFWRDSDGTHYGTTDPGDKGGASRYFQRFYYVSKASRAERNRGCEGLPEVTTLIGASGHKANPSADNKPVIDVPRQNIHPTVKSITLMRYLVRLITPPGGIVLDCFAGSGSTCVAAIHEGMHFIGIEMNDTQDEPYVTIARARIEQAFREVQL